MAPWLPSPYSSNLVPWLAFMAPWLPSPYSSNLAPWHRLWSFSPFLPGSLAPAPWHIASSIAPAPWHIASFLAAWLLVGFLAPQHLAGLAYWGTCHWLTGSFGPLLALA